MPTRSTKPEVAIRSELHRRGMRFRLHRKDLPGTPDIVFPRQRIAVFIDGCFWHRCPEHWVLPKNNREWWRTKFEANVLRDDRKDAQLRDMGWTPLHVWEHEFPSSAADRIELTVRGDRRRSSHAIT